MWSSRRDRQEVETSTRPVITSVKRDRTAETEWAATLMPAARRKRSPPSARGGAGPGGWQSSTAWSGLRGVNQGRPSPALDGAATARTQTKKQHRYANMGDGKKIARRK